MSNTVPFEACGMTKEQAEKMDTILSQMDEKKFYRDFVQFIEDTTYYAGIGFLERWWETGLAYKYKEFLEVYSPEENPRDLYPWNPEKKPFEDAGVEFGAEETGKDLDTDLDAVADIYVKYTSAYSDGNLPFWRYVVEDPRSIDLDGFLDDELADLKDAEKSVFEAVEDLNAGATYDQIDQELDDTTLEQFCQQLDFLVKSQDEKARQLFNTFKQGWKAEFKNIKVKQAFVNIRELHPTQNVIYAKKSLTLILNGQWRMKGVKYAVDALLGSEKPQIEMGDPIVVCNVGGVDYLIDGHHRWSKAYAFNPSCTMKAYIIEGGFKDEDEVLKFAQGTLTLLRNKSPINAAQPANDFNMYDITPQQLQGIVNEFTSKDVLAHISNAAVTKGVVTDVNTLFSYLWSNVRIMRQYAPKGAHDRDVMPQFPDGDTNPKNALDAIKENTKVTLTLEQLNKLLKEVTF